MVTGIRASDLDKDTRLQIGEWEITYVRTFCAVPPGQAFWYENSFGLVELAVNQGNACCVLGLGLGDRIELGRVDIYSQVVDFKRCALKPDFLPVGSRMIT